MEDINGFGKRSRRKKRVLNDESSLNINNTTTKLECINKRGGMILGNLDLNSIPSLGSTMKFGYNININRENMRDEKWRKQKISELEVY